MFLIGESGTISRSFLFTNAIIQRTLEIGKLLAIANANLTELPPLFNYLHGVTIDRLSLDRDHRLFQISNTYTSQQTHNLSELEYLSLEYLIIYRSLRILEKYIIVGLFSKLLKLFRNLSLTLLFFFTVCKTFLTLRRKSTIKVSKLFTFSNANTCFTFLN